MTENPSYYAVIPASVRYDERLKPCARLLYGEITALCDKKGYCWATNAYFAGLYKVNQLTASRWISQLVKYKHIRIEIIYKEGTAEIVNRYIRLNQEGIDEKINTPIDEKIKENITFSLNATLNEEAKKENRTPSQELPEEEKEPAPLKAPSRIRFRKPTPAEVDAYATESRYAVDGSKFCDYYDSNGWKVGTHGMVDWKAAVRTWNGKARPEEREAIEAKRNADRPQPRCPYCGRKIWDNICNNRECPQYEDGFDASTFKAGIRTDPSWIDPDGQPDT